jgi:hypothetical protein
MVEIISSSTAYLALILGYGILTHGIIFLNDGLHWDGWLVEVWQQNRDRNSMRRFYSEVGMPTLYYEHWILGHLPQRQLAYRGVSLASILIIAVFIFLIAVYTKSFNPQQAAMISLLLLSFPAYAVTMDGVASLQYTFKVALFYMGCYFAVATINNPDIGHILIFSISLILFFVAFNANSLLSYFGGFLLFYIWLVHTQTPAGFDAREYAKVFLLIVLPIAYWVTKETFAPRHGYYKNYNRILIRPFLLLKIGFQSLRYGISVPMVKPTLELVRSKSVILILASISVGSLVSDFSKDLLTIQKYEAVQILLIGYALLYLGAVPFILTGQGFSEGGWASKNFMLFHLPFALVVFGWLQLIPHPFGIILTPIVLLANTFYIIKIHLLYIAISVKDKALIRWLALNPQLGSASIIKIRDSHWFEYPFESKTAMYRPAYLSCMIKLIWPGSRILTILDSEGASRGRSLTVGEIEEALEATTIRYSFAPQVQSGPQYLITIVEPNDRFDGARFGDAFDEVGDVNPIKQSAMVRIALKYLYLKWFSSNKLSELFEQYFFISASKL